MAAPATYSTIGEKAGVDASSMASLSRSLDAGGSRALAVVPSAIAQAVILAANLNTAQNYFNVNKKDFDFFALTYEGSMAGALTEAIQRPLYESGIFSPQYGTLDYLASTGRGASIGARKLDKQWYATRRRVAKYHTGLGRWVDYKFSMGKVNETLNGWNLGFRYEDHRKEVYDEQRHAHRTNILNIGIGVGNSARRGLATAVGQLSEARSQLSSQFGSISTGAAFSKGVDDSRSRLASSSTSKMISDSSGVYKSLPVSGDKNG